MGPFVKEGGKKEQHVSEIAAGYALAMTEEGRREGHLYNKDFDIYCQTTMAIRQAILCNMDL